MTPFRVRRGEPGDADAIARTLQVAQAHTYAAIMPAQFVVDRVAEIPDVARARRDEMVRDREVEAAGGEPFRRWWVAEGDDEDAVVAVACAGHGPCDWEGLFRPPPVSYHLDKLYALPRAHGTGVGQALLEAALPPGEPAYLWVLRGNPRAERFYRRNGFVDEGYAATSGPAWFHRPMFRMVSPGVTPAG